MPKPTIINGPAKAPMGLRLLLAQSYITSNSTIIETNRNEHSVKLLAGVLSPYGNPVTIGTAQEKDGNYLGLCAGPPESVWRIRQEPSGAIVVAYSVDLGKSITDALSLEYKDYLFDFHSEEVIDGIIWVWYKLIREIL